MLRLIAYHVTKKTNLNSILSKGLIPSIGERSLKLGESQAGIYLFPTKEDCNNALMNWLGQEFEDVEEDGLVILKINYSGHNIRNNEGIDYEVVVTDIINPPRILDIFNENWSIRLD